MRQRRILQDPAESTFLDISLHSPPVRESDPYDSDGEVQTGKEKERRGCLCLNYFPDDP